MLEAFRIPYLECQSGQACVIEWEQAGKSGWRAARRREGRKPKAKARVLCRSVQNGKTSSRSFLAADVFFNLLTMYLRTIRILDNFSWLWDNNLSLPLTTFSLLLPAFPPHVQDTCITGIGGPESMIHNSYSIAVLFCRFTGEGEGGDFESRVGIRSEDNSSRLRPWIITTCSFLSFQHQNKQFVLQGPCP